jgi:predicted  nucleic acid-binding Zn-ribbon protein
VSNIKEQLETLVALQRAENEIGRIEQELAGIDGRIASLDTEVTTYESRVTDYQEAIDTLRKQYRSDENEVKQIDAQIVKSKEKLRAVKTNKEYQSMLKEIDDLKHKSSTVEDQMLGALERIEKAESELAVQRVDLEDVKREANVKREEICKIADGQREALVRLRQDREEIWQAVAPKIQTLYLNVKRQGHGIGVAAVLDAVCQVCRMNIPPQQYNELLRLDMVRMCPNCQRIIYPKVLLDEDD